MRFGGGGAGGGMRGSVRFGGGGTCWRGGDGGLGGLLAGGAGGFGGGALGAGLASVVAFAFGPTRVAEPLLGHMPGRAYAFGFALAVPLAVPFAFGFALCGTAAPFGKFALPNFVLMLPTDLSRTGATDVSRMRLEATDVSRIQTFGSLPAMRRVGTTDVSRMRPPATSGCRVAGTAACLDLVPLYCSARSSHSFWTETSVFKTCSSRMRSDSMLPLASYMNMCRRPSVSTTIWESGFVVIRFACVALRSCIRAHQRKS